MGKVGGFRSLTQKPFAKHQKGFDGEPKKKPLKLFTVSPIFFLFYKTLLATGFIQKKSFF